MRNCSFLDRPLLVKKFYIELHENPTNGVIADFDRGHPVVLIMIVKIVVGSLTESDNFDRGHPVVLTIVLYIIVWCNR